MPEQFVINPWGLTGTFAVLMAWSLAFFLYRHANRDRLTILFATVLVVEGAVLVTSSAGLVTLLNLTVERNYYIAHHIADCVMLAAYPLFLAQALPQRILAGLRRPSAVPALIAVATVVCIVDLYVEFWLIAVALSLMFTAALILAVHSIFIARTELARRRAILFALAFGLRDIAWSFIYASGALGLFQGTETLDLIRNQIYAGSTVLYIPIVAYGILSARLLDIQFQVRKGVHRGTMAAAFVAVFFLISEGAASFLSEQFGTVAGLLGATVVVFAVSPLHRLSEWFSGRVVPVDESGEYRAYRKLQMYAVAVEDALAFGEIGPSQRALLDRLRESLNMSAADASRIEADLGIATI